MKDRGATTSDSNSDEALFAEAIPLVAALFDNVISDRQFLRLAELLDQYASVCELYVKYSAQQANLEWLHGQVPAASAAIAATSAPDVESVKLNRETHWREAAWNFIAHPTTLSAIVSGLFVTIFLLSMALITVPDWRPSVAPPALERSDFVARVVRTQQATWSPATEIEANRVTDLYRGQRVELTAGLAELQFDDGATVLLEAPTSLTLTGDGAAQLQRGKLAARVPPRAVGFTIATAYASIVDLGTEFCVAADESATDVSVIEGKVNLKLTGDGQTDSRILSTGEAIRVTSSGVGPAAGVKFTRRISGSDGGPVRLVHETFDHPGFAQDDPANWPRSWVVYSGNAASTIHAVNNAQTPNGPAMLMQHEAPTARAPILSREGLQIEPHERVRVQFEFKLLKRGGNPTIQLRAGGNPVLGRLINITLDRPDADEPTLAWQHTSAFKDTKGYGGADLFAVSIGTWYRLEILLESANGERRPLALKLHHLEPLGQTGGTPEVGEAYLLGPPVPINAVDWDFNAAPGLNRGGMLLDNVVVERLPSASPGTN